MTFFALQCDIKDTKPSVRPDWDRFRWAHCCSGARAEALKTNAENVLEPSAAVTVISRIAVYEPKNRQIIWVYQPRTGLVISWPLCYEVVRAYWTAR